MNKELHKDDRFQVFLLGFSGILMILAFTFLRIYREKRRANKQLQLAYAEIALKNKDIADSINYARKIQQARLPDPEVIHRLFPESFGLFKPKDIVSGDFYWFTDLQNGKAAFAAADCTGHGIPGAFMSLIGMDTLHQAVVESKLHDPKEVLSFINVSLKKSLRQNDLLGPRDGMDIALCVFDRERMELQYAGAHRPLILIRNNELTEIKATKHAIGGLTENHQDFACHTLPVQANDMIYIFTDGYTDQFGGEHNKKFSTRQFRELLLSICTKSAADQEKILDIVFESWRGKHEQIDDVLVIGVRI